jgi:hypothetical protein
MNETPLIVLRSEDRERDEKPVEQTNGPVARQSRAQRQLKDYPQSLQTAARALWG